MNPRNGSSFKEWVPTGSTPQPFALSLTMDNDKNITAKFNDKYSDPYLNMNVTGVGDVNITSYNSSNSATNGVKLMQTAIQLKLPINSLAPFRPMFRTITRPPFVLTNTHTATFST